MAKVVKHVKRSHSKKPEAPHDDEPLTVEALPDDVPTHDQAFHEASQIIHTLAVTTPNLMGTAHGIALIHSAQKWVQQYDTGDEP